jgi:hypothetical protein
VYPQAVLVFDSVYYFQLEFLPIFVMVVMIIILRLTLQPKSSNSRCFEFDCIVVVGFSYFKT